MNKRAACKTLITVIILLSTQIVFACKKRTGMRPAEVATNAETPIATAFAAKSAVAIHLEPDDRSKALVSVPIGQKVEVFASRVPDKRLGEKSYWYKVKYAPSTAGNPAAPVDGYIAEREEMLRDNFIVFQKREDYVATKEVSPGKFEDVKEPYAAIAMTSLNLRKSPALNGEIIRPLKNGEVLSVLEESSKKITIRDRSGSWYLLKDDAGVTGYAYGGYLLSGGKSAINELKDVGFQFASGWVIPIANNAKILANATGSEQVKITDDNRYQVQKSWVDNDGILPVDVYAKVDGFTTKGNQLRYRVVSRRMVDIDYYQVNYYYVDKKKVRYVKDYYSVSKDLPHTIDVDLAKDINTFVGGDVNLQCTKVTEFSAGSDANARRFLALNVGLGAPSDNKADETCQDTGSELVFSELGGEKRTFYKSPSKGDFKDLDGDQVPELVTQFQGRGSWSLEIYSVKPNKVVELLKIGGDADGGTAVESGSIDDAGILYLSEPYVCNQKDAESVAACKEKLTQVKELKFLKFDSKMKPLPFYGKLVNGRFVQVPKPADT